MSLRSTYSAMPRNVLTQPSNVPGTRDEHESDDKRRQEPRRLAFWQGIVASEVQPDCTENLGAVKVEPSPSDIELETAASRIPLQGARYPEELRKMVGR